MILISTSLRAANSFSRIIAGSLRIGVFQWHPIAGLKSLEEKVGLPPKPKKPLTPFFQYIKQMRPIVIAENPHFKATEIIKLIAQKWENVDSTIKEKLQEQYKQEKIVYIENRAKYDSQITEKQQSEIKQLKQEINAAKEKRLTKKRIAQLDRPKKPPSAFLEFIIQERTLTPQSSDQSYREWHSNMTQKWSRLSDAEKEPYLKMFRDKLVKYKEDIAVWEEKMVRIGNVDVVRHDLLIDAPLKSKK